MRKVQSVRKSRRRVRKPFIVLGLLLLVIASVFTLRFVKNLFSASGPLAFNEVEIYQIEELDNITFNITFTNNKKINKIIEEEILRVSEENESIFTTKADLEINVSGSIDEENNFLSLIYENASSNIQDIYGVTNIDLNNNSLIDNKTLAYEDLKGLSMLLREALAKDENLRYNKAMYLNTAYDLDLFEFANFTNEGLEFTFKAETFDLDKHSSVTLAYADVLPYLSDEMALRIDKDFSRPDLSNIRYIDPNKAMVALTYDDGPNIGTSKLVADHFAENDSRLTFFWLGDRIENNKDFVTQVSKLGHEIANHSYDHANFNTLDDAQLDFQTAQMNDRIKELTKQDRVLIRTPYGAANDNVKSKVQSPLIMWSIDTEDWRTRDEASNIESIRNTISDGAIILMHDLYEPSVNAGNKILDEYKDQYQFVTVSELYAYKGIPLENGKLYNSANRR